jgi:hypothetical protein
MPILSSYKPLLLQIIVLPYRQWVAKEVLILHHPKELHPVQGCTSTLSLLGLFLRNQHIAEASASLLILFTCNKGLTNPEYLRVLNKT